MAIGSFSSKQKTSQDFVPIKEVRGGVLVLKDGSLRSLIMCSSINFALKSEDNQTAIIAQFQDFLNSLDFSIQIFVESRRLDIKPYLTVLEERYHSQTSELMKVQTREYIEFIRNFTEGTNIMTKTFFVVVPFSPSVANIKKNPLGMLGMLASFAKKPSKSETGEETTHFEEHKMQLEQRIAVVEQGLVRCGIRTVLLGSEETIELFYKLFNPGESEHAIPIGKGSG